MRRIVDYKVVEADLVSIGSEVKHNISLGWRPIGGISVCNLSAFNSYAFFCAQAMVKYEETPDENTTTK